MFATDHHHGSTQLSNIQSSIISQIRLPIFNANFVFLGNVCKRYVFITEIKLLWSVELESLEDHWQHHHEHGLGKILTKTDTLTR